MNKMLLMRTKYVSQPSPDRILAAGPITKQPGTKWFRVVLHQSEHSYELVVHNQYEPNTPDQYYGEGDYFFEEDLHGATARFAERVARMAPSIESIYREETCTKKTADSHATKPATTECTAKNPGVSG